MKKYSFTTIVIGSLLMFNFLLVPRLCAQNNTLPTTGNAFLYYLNYLRAGDQMFFQAPLHANTGYTRGTLTSGIYFDNNNLNWQTNGGTYSDFAMLRFENSGSIGLFTRASTGSSYAMTDAELDSYRRFSILSNGYVGVGTRAPFSLFHVNGVANFRSTTFTDGYVSINPGTATTQGYINWWKPGNIRVAYMGHNDGASASNLALNLESANFIVNGGNVGIGTADPKGYKLAVAGNMIAESVKVKLQAAWPDFVFEKSFALPTLKETETHIKEKGHLPGIPSAAEVKANGIDLGEMNAKLLQKIEELTLHLIDQRREFTELKSSFEVQKTLLIRQEQQIREILQKSKLSDNR